MKLTRVVSVDPRDLLSRLLHVGLRIQYSTEVSTRMRQLLPACHSCTCKLLPILRSQSDIELEAASLDRNKDPLLELKCRL